MPSGRDGRVAALQYLYAWSLNPPANLAEDLRVFFENCEQPREHYAFGEELIHGVIEHVADIDARIKALAHNWEFERIAKIDLAILRVAMFEMIYRKDIPPVVSINEAIDLSKQFSNADAKRFINGILDRVKDQLGRDARKANDDDGNQSNRKARMTEHGARLSLGIPRFADVRPLQKIQRRLRQDGLGDRGEDARALSADGRSTPPRSTNWRRRSTRRTSASRRPTEILAEIKAAYKKDAALAGPAGRGDRRGGASARARGRGGLEGVEPGAGPGYPDGAGGPPAKKPIVIAMIGVNGSGKTTTAAKLAWRLKEDGQSRHAGGVRHVSRGGGRAAQELGDAARSRDHRREPHRRGRRGGGVRCVAGGEGARRDYLIVDTAGRLHTKGNLMEELAKIRRVLQKNDPTAPQHRWLVVDGSLGSNSIEQAKVFHQSFGLTGLVVTKLDGTSRGGALVGIYRQLKIPIYFLGLGEQAEDLQPFQIRGKFRETKINKRINPQPRGVCLGDSRDELFGNFWGSSEGPKNRKLGDYGPSPCLILVGAGIWFPGPGRGGEERNWVGFGWPVPRRRADLIFFSNTGRGGGGESARSFHRAAALRPVP